MGKLAAISVAFALAATSALAQTQPTVKVSTLVPATTPFTGAEQFYIVQGGVSKSVTATVLGSQLGGGGGGGGITVGAAFTGCPTPGYVAYNNSGVVGCTANGGGGGGSYTFSTGLTNTANVITLGDQDLSYAAGAMTLGKSGVSGFLSFYNSTNAGVLQLFAGANSGNTALTLPATGAPDTVAVLAAPQSFTNKSLVSSSDILGGVTMTLGSDNTGDMYYRNSSGVLTALPVCTGSTFITGLAGIPSCQTPAGGGNVSNTGTPTAGQVAVWTTATVVQGLSSLPYTAGGTGLTTVTPNDCLVGNSGGTAIIWAACSGASITFSTGLTNTANTITLGDASLAYATGTLSLGSLTQSGKLTFYNSANTGTTSLLPLAASSNTSLFLPIATSGDTLVDLLGVQTLTNKTLVDASNVIGGVTMTLGSDHTGDMYYRNSFGQLTRLPVSTTTGQFLGWSGGIPAWATPASAGPGGKVIYAANYGVVCDNSTINTTALTNAFAAITVNTTLIFPGGVCLYSGTYTAPVVSNVNIIGTGGTQLVYAGSSSASNLITFGQTGSTAGGGNCSGANWTVQNIQFFSNTTQSGGYGVSFLDMCELNIVNVRFGEPLPSIVTVGYGFYNAVRFIGGNTIHVVETGAQAQNVAMTVAGDGAGAGNVPLVDMYIWGGAVAHSVTGLLIGGNLGGINVGAMDAVNNHTNVRIDQSIAGRYNAQAWFGDLFASDGTTGSPNIGVDLEDAGISGSIITFDGSWVSTASGTCLKIGSSVTAYEVRLENIRMEACGSGGASSGTYGLDDESTGAIVIIDGGLYAQSSVAQAIIKAVSGAQLTWGGTPMMYGCPATSSTTGCTVGVVPAITGAHWLENTGANMQLGINGCWDASGGTATQSGGTIAFCGPSSGSNPGEVLFYTGTGTTSTLAGYFDNAQDLYTFGSLRPYNSIFVSNGGVGTGALGSVHLGSSGAAVAACWSASSGLATLGTCTSDERLKDQIEPIDDDVLTRVLALTPITYHWKKNESGPLEAGFSAQKVRQLFPLAVQEDDEETFVFSSANLVPYLVKGLQEMNGREDNRFNYLESRIDALERRIGGTRASLQ